jgi:hypothetical protein
MTITAARLKKLLSYDRQTGEFRWLEDRGSITAGSLAGRRHWKGHVEIKVDGRLYAASRLAWLCEYGDWPASLVGFKDNNRSNTAIQNLIQLTRSQAMANQPGPNRRRAEWLARARKRQLAIRQELAGIVPPVQPVGKSGAKTGKKSSNIKG